MWLYYRVVSLILFLDIMLLCDAQKRQDSRRKKTALDLSTNITANVLKLTNSNGRYVAQHNPITCDGYILSIFRLTLEKNISPLKNPVLLVHGMYQSSDRWLIESKTQKSLAFKLQDLGYDVWLFNARGNKYSRKHMYLVSECDEKHEFFEYTFEEIGLMDIAATVNYILNATSFKKITYIGHSMGGTEFLILNSLKPEYNDLFDKAFLLAPYGYHRHFPHSELKSMLKTNLKTFDFTWINNGYAELFPYTCTKEEFKSLPKLCLGDIERYEPICEAILIQEIMGLQSDVNTKANTRGGSLKQFIHFAQNVQSTLFRRFMYSNDYENIQHYGEASPPEYDLAAVTVPTTIYYSMNDEFVSHHDIHEISRKIANATLRRVAGRNFKHNDFVNSQNAMFFVYDGIIKSLSGYHPAPHKPDPQNPDPHKPDPHKPDPHKPDPHKPDPHKPDKVENYYQKPDPNYMKSTSKFTWIVIVLVGAGISLCVCIAIVSWIALRGK